MTDSGSFSPRDTSFSLPEIDPRDQATLTLLGHDLRAALSDVIGGLRLIAPADFEPMARVQIERVRSSAEVLARLLEQGLSLMLGEPGPSSPAHLNLHRFLTDLDLRWSGRALELGTGFALRRSTSLPVHLRMDRVALDRVLSNLLGNAFKYGGRGQVICEVSLRADGWLGFTVRDDGPGFPASMIDRQLPFHGRPPGMTKPGNGMGLHIAADLTRHMGGRMVLRNLDPTGAEAQVDLPVMSGIDETGETASADPFLIGKRVLIADDNLTSQTILCQYAMAFGAEVVVVGDGVEAVGRLERESFDLLIVDVEMPRLSGLDVIRCLRAMPGAVARMPAIAVTAYTLRSNRLAIMAAGANDMLSKPLYCRHAFEAVVRGAMDGTAGRPASAVEHSPPSESILEEDRLYRLLAMAGPETGRDLLDRLMTDLTGVERGLVQAGSLPDWDAIRKHSHVLISLAGAVGGLQLQAEAEVLNQLAHRTDRAALPGCLSNLLIQLDSMIQFVSQVRDQHKVPAG